MTKIEWTEKTWNPVRGCARVSAGCEHCYAERMVQILRFNADPIVLDQNFQLMIYAIGRNFQLGLKFRLF